MRFLKLKMLFRSSAQLTLDKTWHCFNLSFLEEKDKNHWEYQSTPQSTLLLILFLLLLLLLLMMVIVVLLFRPLTAAGGRKAASGGAVSSSRQYNKPVSLLPTRFNLSLPLSHFPIKSDPVRSGALESDGMPADYIRWHQIR